MTDGIHREGDNIYTVSSLNSCSWKIVGVSFTDEVTQSVKKADSGRLGVCASVQPYYLRHGLFPALAHGHKTRQTSRFIHAEL